MLEVGLVVLGAVLGVGIKAFVDPVLETRRRRRVKREEWLEDALRHAEGVRHHLQSVRMTVSAPLGYDGDAIAAAIIGSLTEEHAPRTGATSFVADDELDRTVRFLHDAWITVGITRADLQHGAEPAEEKYEPLFAEQAYSIALDNFVSAARRHLAR